MSESKERAPRKRAPAVKRKKKPAAWTADKKVTFLAKLAASANVSASARAWAWLDGSDAPLAEETERYRLTITPAVGVQRTVETGSAGYDYLPAQQLADSAAGAAAIDVTLMQLGSFAASQAISRHFNF